MITVCALRITCWEFNITENISISEIIHNFEFQNPFCIFNDTLLPSNMNVKSLFNESDSPLVVFNSHARNITSFKLQTILYQSITGYSMMTAIFVLKIMRLGNNVDFWNEALPSINAVQTYEGQESDANFHLENVSEIKIYLEILSPYNTHSLSMIISTSETIGGIKQRIQKLKGFVNRDLLMFAPTKISLNHYQKSMDIQSDDDCKHDESFLKSVQNCTISNCMSDGRRKIVDNEWNKDEMSHVKLLQNKLNCILNDFKFYKTHFFQLRNNRCQISQLPFLYQRNETGGGYHNKYGITCKYKTFIYILPLSESPKDMTKLEMREVFEWTVGQKLMKNFKQKLKPIKISKHNIYTVGIREKNEFESEKIDIYIYFETILKSKSKMFITRDMNVLQFEEKIKSLKQEYRYSNIGIFVHNSILNRTHPFPLSRDHMLSKSIIPQQKHLEVVIKSIPQLSSQNIEKKKKKKPSFFCSFFCLKYF